MRRHRHRFLYYLTGLPRWARCRFSFRRSLYWNFPQFDEINELTYLKQLKQDLEKQINYVNERISELEKK